MTEPLTDRGVNRSLHAREWETIDDRVWSDDLPPAEPGPALASLQTGYAEVPLDLRSLCALVDGLVLAYPAEDRPGWVRRLIAELRRAEADHYRPEVRYEMACAGQRDRLIGAGEPWDGQSRELPA